MVFRSITYFFISIKHILSSIFKCIVFLLSYLERGRHMFTNPRMTQCLSCRKPLPRILPQQTLDKIHSIITLVKPSIALKVQSPPSRTFLNFGIRRSIEGWVATEENVGDNPHGPNVRCCIIFSLE